MIPLEPLDSCLECKHSLVIEDNHNDYHSICVCAESGNFLQLIDIIFGRCEYGEREQWRSNDVTD